MIGISSCLCGLSTTYSGKHHLQDRCKELLDNGQAIAICPEVLGGLSIPRDPCEVIGKKVMSSKGIDCTEEYLRGANKALEILKKNNIKIVILKSHSPSCGRHDRYDGTFSHQVTSQSGITAQLFENNGIEIYNENEIDQVIERIKEG